MGLFEASRGGAISTHGSQTLLAVEGLTVDFLRDRVWWNVVNHVSFVVRRGEAYGLVGESGCGKSTTAYCLLGYHRPSSRVRAGKVQFLGRDILSLQDRALQRIRGKDISIVPQNPATALSPGLRVGDQICELMKAHARGASRKERHERALELFAQTRLPQPKSIAQRFPHELSGGQQQRVMIAMALACDPQLVVLDEPTTGLDVTTQAQIVELLIRLRSEHQLSMVYVTHNLAVLSMICDRVGVMYAGELVEESSTDELFRHPRHPYTQGLIASLPLIDGARPQKRILLRGILQRESLPVGCRFAPRCEYAEGRCYSDAQALDGITSEHRVACCRWKVITSSVSVPKTVDTDACVSTVSKADPVLEVTGLNCSYGRHPIISLAQREMSLVVRNVSFELRAGETLALVGESGSGKSTIARACVGLVPPLSGILKFEGKRLPATVAGRSLALLRKMQLVLQNPDASLNPRRCIEDIIGRPLTLYFKSRGGSYRKRVARLLEDVRLPTSYARRFPDELSGGERQRVAIARALAAEPTVLLCDEVLSALDVSVQADILDLLRTLQAERGISYLFISHDMAVVRSLAHRIAVLYHGELCDVGQTEEVFSPPFHPYTQALLAAVPRVDVDPLPTAGDATRDTV
ncbi:MAG TPA: ABC transporter ATP-binding protein [bacterium]|nr:ABC transporter ATP-binding protein [bacterium]